MNKPIKYRGQFIVTTKSNKPVKVCCSKEQAEYYLENGNNRKLFQWINNTLNNEYCYKRIK